jgi:4-amino-4-deoxy-L-arabinose transferase-like glycosyltransferase
MTAFGSEPLLGRRSFPDPGVVFLILILVTMLRLVGLKLSVVDLFIDEAQYWSWSREPAFGYFSKPPLLAWVMAAAEYVCGDEEWCVRAPAPILYFAASLCAYGIGKTCYDTAAGCWAALLVGLGTGVVFSARIISTDVPLLLFWALALLAYTKLLAGAGSGWIIALGGAIGFGLLAKYSMIYFLPGMLLAAAMSKRARMFLRQPPCWAALAVAAIIVVPNILWNISNDLITFRLTGDLVLGEDVKLNLLGPLEFLAAQFGVFGPIVFGVFVLAAFRLKSLPEPDRLMVAFGLPALVLVVALAPWVHVYANWAGVSFISAAVVTAAILLRTNRQCWVVVSVLLGAVVQVALIWGDAIADQVSLPFLSNPYYRTLGWKAFGSTAGQLAHRLGASTIVSDNRGDVAELLYYWRDKREKILSWRTTALPNFDLTRGLSSDVAGPILFVTACSESERIRPFYSDIEPQGQSLFPAGRNGARGFFAFKLGGNLRTISPLTPCPTVTRKAPRP